MSEEKTDLENLCDKIRNLVETEGYDVEEIKLISSDNIKINSDSWDGEMIAGEIKLKATKTSGLMAYEESNDAT